MSGIASIDLRSVLLADRTEITAYILTARSIHHAPAMIEPDVYLSSEAIADYTHFLRLIGATDFLDHFCHNGTIQFSSISRRAQ